MAPFEGLAPDELERLARSASRQSVRDGGALFEAGEPASEIYLLESGRVTLRAADARGSTIVMSAGPGELLGWSALRPSARWMTTGRAVGDVSVIELPAGVVFDLLTSGTPSAALLAGRLFAIAAAHLDQTQSQLLRSGGEGTITGG
jgi:CRP-like cAMP-binding protein